MRRKQTKDNLTSEIVCPYRCMPGCGGLWSALVLARQRLRSQQEPQRMPLHPDARRHGRTRFHVLSFPAGACFRAPDCIRALAHVTFFGLLVLTLCMALDCMGVCVTVGSLLPGCPQASPDPDYYNLRPRTTSTCPRKALGDHTASVSYPSFVTNSQSHRTQRKRFRFQTLGVWMPFATSAGA